MKETVYIDEDYQELMSMYLTNQKKTLKEILNMIKVSDHKGLVFMGHKIKGSADNYGFYEVGKLGKALELAGQDRDFDKANALIEDIEAYMAHIRIEYIKI